MGKILTILSARVFSTVACMFLFALSSIRLLCAADPDPAYVSSQWITRFPTKMKGHEVVESVDVPPNTRMKVIRRDGDKVWLEHQGVQADFPAFTFGLPAVKSSADIWLENNNKCRAKAVEKYPALGFQGSAFNNAFIAEYERRKKTAPESLLKEDWPMQISDKIAESQPNISDIKAPQTSQQTQSSDTGETAMIRENGVLKVPILINGAISLKFVVDSGASDIQIPKDVFLTLIRAETIKESDFLPGKTFVMADGSKVKSDRFILSSLKIGETTLLDVEASIGSLDAPLLLERVINFPRSR
jgi:gag-polyprotein putative aspartyl protease